MRVYYDTEFANLEGIRRRDMISAGFVAEDGRELYVEITDFLPADCSQFVRDTVLPLLGKGDVLPQRMAGQHFGWRLCAWLDSLGAPELSLVADSQVDWWLLQEYAQDISTPTRRVQSERWQRSDSPIVAARLASAEAAFWRRPGNVGMQHHALYDARRLKMLAEQQRSYYHCPEAL